MANTLKPFPLYTSRGDWAAMLVGIYIYNPQGEWIGFIDKKSNVYSVVGEYVGWLARDFRILRKRFQEKVPPKHTVPPKPNKMRMPSSTALPPMMAEISYDTIDVLDDMPELLFTADNNPWVQDLGG